MILDNVSPTYDVAVVSVQQVRAKLGLKHMQTLLSLLRKSLKYVAYHESIDDDKLIIEAPYQDFKYNNPRYADSLPNNKARVNPRYTQLTSNRVMMPLDTAWRLIRDAEAGKILAKAERV